jgi:lipid-binding SYLF domain-containing protein
MWNRRLPVIFFSIFFLCASAPVIVSGNAEHQYRERSTNAAAVLESLTRTPDDRIPASLLRRADAVAVIPDMVKGTFESGDTYGRGLISERLDDGRWSAPAFVTIAGGSFGQKLGDTATDLVLVITNKRAISSLLNGTGVKLGIDAGVLAGPLGRTEEAGVAQNAPNAIFAYAHSKGAFAGIALSGEVINIDQDADERVYGQQISTADILTRSNLASNVSVYPFVEALNRVISDTPTES